VLNGLIKCRKDWAWWKT